MLLLSLFKPDFKIYVIQFYVESRNWELWPHYLYDIIRNPGKVRWTQFIAFILFVHALKSSPLSLIRARNHWEFVVHKMLGKRKVRYVTEGKKKSIMWTFLLCMQTWVSFIIVKLPTKWQIILYEKYRLTINLIVTTGWLFRNFSNDYFSLKHLHWMKMIP